MKCYTKNGKIIIRYSYYDDILKKYKIANFTTGKKVKYWNQKDLQAVDDSANSQYVNYKFREHYGMIQDLLMKYPPLVALEKYDDYKQQGPR